MALDKTFVFASALTAAVASSHAVTPPFPDPVGGKVTVAAGVTNTVTEADDLSGITEIELPNANSTIIFDISKNASYTYAGLIRGRGVIIKDGLGKLTFSNTTIPPT